MLKHIMNYLFYPWLVFLIGMIIYAYFKGRSVLEKFKSLNLGESLYAEKYVSGYSTKSFTTRFIRSNPTLAVIITKSDLIIKTNIFFAFIENLRDMLHIIPINKIIGLEIKNSNFHSKLFIHFHDTSNQEKRIVLYTKNNKLIKGIIDSMKIQHFSDVILVDDQDREIGRIEKLEAHKKGLLHRAFSVFIFNNKGEMLLQQRAKDKYHSGGLWTNTCCSHPAPGESILEAANRRLKDEMGMTCDLKEVFQFTYKAELDNDLIEHELDHVLIGSSNNDPEINIEEAMAFKWMDLTTIEKELQNNPELYTFWFKEIIKNEQFREIINFNQ